MKTNDIKKGMRFLLKCGWYATMKDNMKGNTRLAEVEGYFTEIGSVYAHDITSVQLADGSWEHVEHTPKQVNLEQAVFEYFGG